MYTDKDIDLFHGISISTIGLLVILLHEPYIAP